MRHTVTGLSLLLLAALGDRLIQLRRREREIERSSLWPEDLAD